MVTDRITCEKLFEGVDFVGGSKITISYRQPAAVSSLGVQQTTLMSYSSFVILAYCGYNHE